MAKVYGMTFAGHGIRGPGLDLLHLEDSNHETFVVIEFNEEFAQHSSLTKGLSATIDSLKAVEAPGLASVQAWHEKQGALVYRDEGAISVRELTRAFRKLEKPIGEKAGLEFLISVARALVDFQGAAEAADLYCHGSISPWTLFVKPDGTTLIIGFGVPPAPLFAFIDQQVDSLSSNAFKYCPPERLENGDEDIRSDFLSLALVTAEIMTGEWVYDGKADEVLEAIITGKGPKALEEIAQDLSDPTFELLAKAIEPKVAARFAAPAEFLAEAEAALKNAKGPSLAEAYSEARRVGIGDDLDFDLDEEVAPPQAPEPEKAAPLAPAPAPKPPEIAPAPVQKAPPPQPATPIPAPQQPTAASGAGGLPSIGPGATVEDVHQRARDLADKAEGLVGVLNETIEKCRPLVTENSAVLTPILDEMSGSVRRAGKAAKATRSSVSLVELDESVEDALMSLELLLSSVQQVEAALKEVKEGEQTIQDTLRAQRAEAQAIELAHEQADECTAQAHQAWSEAQEALASLTADIQSGKLAAPGSDQILREAEEATERAQIATVDATEAAANAGNSDTGIEAKVAVSIARTAVETAKTASEGVREAIEKALKLAQKAKDAALQKMRAHATAAGESFSRADQAVQRADQALQVGPSAEASRLRDEAADHHKAVQACVELQEQIMSRAQDLNTWPSLVDAIKSSNEQNTRAKESAEKAVACSDQIVSLAGEAAAAAAALSKAIDEATRIHERIESLTEQGREELNELLTETEGISSTIAIQARSAAVAAVTTAEKVLASLTNQLGQTEGQKESDSAQLIVDEMKENAVSAETSLKSARQSMREAQESAEQELQALKKERAHTKALNEAIDRAQTFTNQCQELVEKAWAVYNGASAELKTTAIPRASELRASAHEIIDVADYQAKEAVVASRQAAEQTEPAEAESYADTARSFAERIAEDLPEAHAALEEAEELATREVRQILDARKQTEGALESALEIRAFIQATIQEGVTAAAPWPQVASVSSTLTKLRGSQQGLDVDIQELTYARDRSHQVEKANEAQEVLPRAKTALQRAQAKKTAIESALNTLKQAVSAAEQEQAAKVEAIAETQRLQTAATEVVGVIQQAAKALNGAVAQHAASGDSVRASAKKMKDSEQRSEKASQVIAAAVQAIQHADSAAKANQLLAKVRESLKVIEGCRDQAVEVGTSGAAEAEREATARAEASERRLTNAHDSALSSAEQAQRAVNALLEKLASTEGEITNSSSGEANSLRVKAEKSAAIIGEQLSSLMDDANEVSQDTVADSAEREANAIAQRLGTIGALVSKALKFLDEAVDEARSAAAEEEALAKIRLDALALSEQVKAEVLRSKSEAEEVQKVVEEGESEATKQVASETDEHVETAEKAAIKIGAALPMLDNADSLPVAQGILKTCRKALERATECANANAALVQVAKARLQEERELAAKKLAEARRSAQAPATQAAAAAIKANGWLETGEREANGFDAEAIKAALATLKTSVDAVKDLANGVAEIAIEASLAGTVEAAAEVEVKVGEAAATAMEAAKHSREALEALRAAVEQDKADQAQVEVLQMEAAQHTTETEKVKTAIHESLSKLHEALAANEHEGEQLSSFLKQADAVGERIDELLATALTLTTEAVEAKALNVVTEKAGGTKACFEQGVALLEELITLDAKSREEATRLAAEAEENAKRAREDARKEREEARLAKERERKAVREAATQAFPVNRKGGGDDRRARFERAKAERESKRGGGDDLRARLRGSRARSRGAASERPVRPTGSPRPGAGERLRRSERPRTEGAADRRLSRSHGRPAAEPTPESQEIQLPPGDSPEEAMTEATPRRRVRRREETEPRQRPTQRERSPRRSRASLRNREEESKEDVERKEDVESKEEGVPQAAAPEEPTRSRGADDLLARMKRGRNKK